MLKLLIILFAFYGINESRILPKLFEGKIIGGSNADIKDFPYQLSMRYKGKHGCGASIISSKWALSAAHCLEDFTESDIKDLTLVSGSTFRTTGGHVNTVKQTIMHPLYDRKTTDHDYALLKVDSNFPLGSEGVATVKLTSTEPQEGEIAVLTGWGVLHSSVSNLPDHLQKVEVPVVGRTVCKTDYESVTNIADSMICAGYPEGGKDGCRGDSGGPLVSRKTGLQIGVVSFGYGCAQPKYPGVYSNVAYVVDWIKDTTGINV